MREVLQILNDEFRLSMALSGDSHSHIFVTLVKPQQLRSSSVFRLQKCGRNQQKPDSVVPTLSREGRHRGRPWFLWAELSIGCDRDYLKVKGHFSKEGKI